MLDRMSKTTAWINVNQTKAFLPYIPEADKLSVFINLSLIKKYIRLCIIYIYVLDPLLNLSNKRKMKL